MTKVLITGGCGFIGHHLVEHILKETNWYIIVFDKIRSGRLREVLDNGLYDWNNRLSIIEIDINKHINIPTIDCDYIFHLAAETHVDTSIRDPAYVIYNNIMSTTYILEYSRNMKNLKIFLYFGTDEVYGNAPDGIIYNERDRHNPTNPYSASKSASEQICISYYYTYNIPIIRINSMNVFGERQDSEKFIPKIIKYILLDKTINIYDIKGSRYYIHARNISSAILYIINNGTIGECYNIKGEKEVTNIEMVNFIAKIMGSHVNYIENTSIRPNNDRRYDLDNTKLELLGWETPQSFWNSLEKTVKWTINNKHWLH